MDNTNYTMKSIPLDDRPQEKLLKYGANALSNSELIAVILRTGTKEENVVMLAQRILEGRRQGIKKYSGRHH